MSKLKIATNLLIGMVVLFSGVALGRRAGLSQFFAVGVGLVPALLLVFPLVKRMQGSKLSFAQWSLTVGGVALAATLIYGLLG